MGRPTDWHVLDLDRDPAPGSPAGVRALARRFDATSRDASDAGRAVRSLAGDQAVLSWLGLAGEVFRGAIDEFPGQLAKLADSYDRAADALSAYASALDGAQEQADRALLRGREARARLDSLTGQLSGAEGALSSASSAVLSARTPMGSSEPDPDQIRSAVRNQQAAQARVSALQSQVGDAQQDLDLARQLARDAQALREDAAGRAARQVDDAAAAGIEPKSWWEDFTSAVAQVWQVVVTVCKVVVVVLAVVALVVGGPIAWAVLAASLVLLTDALLKWANGEGSLGEVALAALGCIPGVRGLTTVSALTNAFRAGGAMGATGHVLSAGRTAITGMATTVRNAPALLRSLPADLRTAVQVFTRTRADELAAAPLVARTRPVLGFAQTPDGMQVLMMTGRTELGVSFADTARATLQGLREAAQTYGSLRTAQLVGKAEGGYDVVLRYQSGWDDFQRVSADTKAAHLSDAPRELSLTAPGGRDPAVTRTWAAQHPIDPADPDLADFAGNRFDPAHTFDVDHMTDLQLGGANRAGNLWWLESSVNRSEGSQVAGLVRRFDLPDGTLFSSFRFADRGFGMADVVRTGGYVTAGATH